MENPEYPTEITLNFADGRYRFWLSLPMANELEKNITICQLEWHLRESIGITDNGGAVYAGGTVAEVRGIRDTIRLALTGGGGGVVDGEEVEVGPQRARELCDAYVYPYRPLAEAATLAWRILAAAVYGNDPEAHPLGSASDPAPAPAPKAADAPAAPTAPSLGALDEPAVKPRKTRKRGQADRV